MLVDVKRTNRERLILNALFLYIGELTLLCCLSAIRHFYIRNAQGFIFFFYDEKLWEDLMFFDGAKMLRRSIKGRYFSILSSLNKMSGVFLGGKCIWTL